MKECVVCGGLQQKPLYTGILQCETCGHVFADLSLNDEELLKIYHKSYFSGDEYSDYVADKQVIQKNFALRMKVLKRFLDPDRHKKVLEVGSAYGFFLEMIYDQFEHVSGIDITEDGVRHARDQLNLDVVQADLLQYDYQDRLFDVVCLWDTIEHLRCPNLYLEKISRHMPADGLIAITTGDIDSLNARLKKEHWRLIHPPTHIHYFSKRTLARLLRNYGFEVIYNSYSGFYRSMKNVAYNVLVLRRSNQKFYNLLERLGAYHFDFYLNMYDIMYVIAKKKGA